MDSAQVFLLHARLGPMSRNKDRTRGGQRDSRAKRRGCRGGRIIEPCAYECIGRENLKFCVRDLFFNHIWVYVNPIFGFYCSSQLVPSLSLLAREQMFKMASTRLAVKIFNVVIYPFTNQYTFREL